MFIKNVKIKNKKNIPRIFINDFLTINQDIFLSKNTAHYVNNVLRMKIDDILEIFNNTNYVFFARITSIRKNVIHIIIFQSKEKNLESNLNIHLGQVISKQEKMDFTIQKSVELGVHTITPLFSDYSSIKKNFMRISQKKTHWEKIVISACQQCHRNIIPMIRKPTEIQQWCKKNEKDEIKIILHPHASLNMKHLPQSIKNIRILIGAEKGFSKDEIKYVKKYDFIEISLGPRILRTETASIAAISMLQIMFGDL